MAKLNFNAKETVPAGDFTPIPTGWYPAVITESENIPTATGNGSYLKLVFTLTGNKYADRKVFLNLNLDNPNAIAVEIAQKQLSAICYAINVLTLTDSQQLHNKPLSIKVAIEAPVMTASGEEKFPAKNVIKGFRSSVSEQPAPTWKQKDTAETESLPPWMKNNG